MANLDTVMSVEKAEVFQQKVIMVDSLEHI